MKYSKNKINKLCAGFIGKHIDDPYCDDMYYLNEVPSVPDMVRIPGQTHSYSWKYVKKYKFSVENMRFHNDWNWIMRVVGDILDPPRNNPWPYSYHTQLEYVEKSLITCFKAGMVSRICAFIEFHNKEKK